MAYSCENSIKSSPETRGSKPTFPHFILSVHLLHWDNMLKSYLLNLSHAIKVNIEKQRKGEVARSGLEVEH